MLLLSRVALLALLVASACALARAADDDKEQDIDNNEVLPENDVPRAGEGRWRGAEWSSASSAAGKGMDADGLGFAPERDHEVRDQADKDAEVIPVTSSSAPPAATEPATSTSEAPASTTTTTTATPPRTSTPAPKRPGGFLSGFLSDIIQIPINVLQSVGTLLRTAFPSRAHRNETLSA